MAPRFAHKTRDIDGDLPFWSSVDALAAFGRVESRAIGFAATPSKAHAAFEAVCRLARREQLVALLVHESPVVRLYVAEHLIEQGGDLSPLGDVVLDGTEVNVASGCLVMRDSVAGHVLRALRDRPSQAAAPLLREAAAAESLGPARFVALELLAARDPEAGLAMVAALLGDASTPPDALLAALKIARPHLGSSPRAREAVSRLASHEDASVRAALPPALCDIGDEASLASLQALRGDAAPHVSSTADFYLTCHPAADRGEVARLCAQKLASGDRSFLAPMSRSDDPALLSQLVAFARAHPDAGVDIASHPRSDAMDAAALELARIESPSRVSALGYLVRSRVPGALEACRRAHEETQMQGVWRAAAEGVVELSGDGSEASLLSLLQDPMLIVQIVAAERLAEVGGASSIKALEALRSGLEPGRDHMLLSAIERSLARLRERTPVEPAAPRGGWLDAFGEKLGRLLR